MKRSNRRRTSALVAALLALGACGGSDGPSEERAAGKEGAAADGGSAPAGGEQSDARGAAGTKEAKEAKEAAKPGANLSSDGSSGPSGSTSTTVAAAEDKTFEGRKPNTPDNPPLPLEATLKDSCVRAGQTQTITIKSVPQAGVAYNSYYADGKSGIDDGFYGGNNGKVLEEETWTDTWPITAAAPPGKVRVAVGGSHIYYTQKWIEVTFDLVGPTGTCP